MKHRLRKAKHLIKKFNDSWGSIEKHFKQRLINREIVRKARKGSSYE